MFVKSENNLYKTLYLKNTKFKEGDLLNEIKFHHLYRYGNVTFKQFSHHFKPEGYLKRKALALPLAAIALIKAVYHLTRAIFISFSNLFFKSDRPLKVHFFYIPRDLQESFGHFISLFNDCYGSFHIQESQFQKECYALCIHNTFAKLTTEQIQALFISPDPIKTQTRLNIFEIDDTLKAIYEGKLRGPELGCLDTRHLAKLDLTKITLEQSRNIFNPKIPFSAFESHFHLFPAKQVKSAFDQKRLSSQCLFYISEKQLKLFKLSEFSSEEIDILFDRKPEERMKIFSKEDILKALENNLLIQHLSLLPIDLFKLVDPSKLSPPILGNLFNLLNDFDLNKKRFEQIPSANVLKALEKGLLNSDYHLALISESQLKEISTQITKAQKTKIEHAIRDVHFRKQTEAKEKARSHVCRTTLEDNSDLTTKFC